MSFGQPDQLMKLWRVYYKDRGPQTDELCNWYIDVAAYNEKQVMACLGLSRIADKEILKIENCGALGPRILGNGRRIVSHRTTRIFPNLRRMLKKTAEQFFGKEITK